MIVIIDQEGVARDSGQGGGTSMVLLAGTTTILTATLVTLTGGMGHQQHLQRTSSLGTLLVDLFTTLMQQ